MVTEAILRQVLKAAQADAMALVTSHQQPTALMVGLVRLGLPDTAAVRSGLPLSRFLEILASLRIPVVDGTAADLGDDLSQARRWLGSSPMQGS